MAPGRSRTPPRDGEGDRPAQPGGGEVFATDRNTIDLARRERRSGNLPEVILWRALRARAGGFKFRRQHPIAQYSLDFACLGARLAIEVEGAGHDHGDRALHDAYRDDALARLGFLTMRIPARDVFRDLDAVVLAIVAACRAATTPPPSLRDSPPPRSGEVFVEEPS